MNSTRGGLFFSLSERYLLIAIQLASGMILARLLTPEEIGIYSVSLAVIGVAQVLRDFGIGSFIIQAQHLSERHIRTAFGFSLLLGATLFLTIFSLAPIAGVFYDDDRIVHTMRISSINFLILPFCSISISLLRRNMLFKRLALVAVISSLIGFIVGVSLALKGFGPNSMALGAVASNTTTGILAWLARTDRKLLMPGLSEWREILKFGSQSSLAGLVSSVSMDINDLALGRILGFAPVAMLSRAQGIMNLFHRDIMAAIRGVMFPSFAKSHREESSVDAEYIKSVTNITAFAWPFYAFAALYADEIIRLMFGTQWNEAAHLVPWFCLAGAFASTWNLILNAVMAVGRIDLYTKAELVIQPLRATLMVVVAVVFESLTACAIAFFLVYAMSTPFLYWVKGKCIPTNYTSLRSGLVASASLTLTSMALPALLISQVPEQRELTETALLVCAGGALAGLSWLFALLTFNHPLKFDPIVRRTLASFHIHK
ncbi:lipopolysaccharide biosynthesis protein [Chromatocurvus halotolerans]|uniref:O-antigen/teichoic acid export membrane protein n=1 Tax=Chromatocurvus halotolerans TaxID=1132028 RepID=A0A4R2KTB4_9GAMM|nr:lipopolysaccharide biosynthesis protein [Chromatocurvus halotolerans]TCO74309.1 O-antigen/teichoic acid export membrane protein [Chromatocurvus halotolerans]